MDPVATPSRLRYTAIVAGFAMIVFGGVSGLAIHKYRQQQATILAGAQAIEERHLAFAAELYDTIKTNYWDTITDTQLSTLYKLAVEKLTNKPATLASEDLNGVKTLIAEQINNADDAGKKDFVVKLSDIVLANLKPFGRSRLYTKQQETALRNSVENINPEKDLYATLGVPKGASTEEVENAYQSQPKTEERTYAHDVLTKPATKQNYDNGGHEPTVFGSIVKPGVAYMHIKQFAPLTLSEFKNVSDELATHKADALILDLRNNGGGAVDFLQYFLGPFIGPDQYAYEFFHQGEKTPYKTKTGWLDSFRIYHKVVILTDNTVQSSAEVMATALKKYRFGVLVGTPTKGWGTIEQIFPMKHTIDDSQTYSAVLVQSITLRTDGTPIEGRGEDPTINITDKDWESQLRSYYDSTALIAIVKHVWQNPPK